MKEFPAEPAPSTSETAKSDPFSNFGSKIFSSVQKEPEFQCEFSKQEQAVFVAEQLELRLKLKTFIQWSIKQSYSKQFTQDQNLQLLNCAWEAQKLLWSICRSSS